MNDTSDLSYDAVLLVSFGGPEARADVIPFLENVLRGKNVPRQRLEAVAEHYYLFDGVSPINEHCRRLLDDLRRELNKRDLSLPLFWGNRNWHPLLSDTVQEMKDKGCRKAVAFVTSAFSSYSGCRQYLEDIERAREAVGGDAPAIDKIPVFYEHPLFIAANVKSLDRALSQIPQSRRRSTFVAFTAHSLPQTMAGNCQYENQLRQTCQSVAQAAGQENWHLVYQSRSGPPTQPWLEPDICDHLRGLKSEGVTDVIIAPIGFLFDHMEVIYDLDTEAKKLCQELDINLIRADSIGGDPLFVEMVGDLIEKQVRPAVGLQSFGASENLDYCHVECCKSGAVRPSEQSLRP
jgi:ferrochelatase